MELPELERMDWENAKQQAVQQFRMAQVNQEIAKSILVTAEEKLKIFPEEEKTDED